MPSKKSSKTSSRSKKNTKQAETPVAAAPVVAPAAAPVVDTKAGSKRKSDAPVKHRTGTVALHKIAKQQASVEPILSMKPLRERIATLFKKHSKAVNLDAKEGDKPFTWRAKPEAREAIRDAIEGVTNIWLENVRDNSLHRGKKTVYDVDCLQADRTLRMPWWMTHIQKAEADRVAAAMAYTRRRKSGSAKKSTKSKKSSKKATATVDAAATAAPAAPAAAGTQA